MGGAGRGQQQAHRQHHDGLDQTDGLPCHRRQRPPVGRQQARPTGLPTWFPRRFHYDFFSGWF